MGLERLDWTDGAGDDLHLLPGLQSPRFDQLLNITTRVSVTAPATVTRADAPPPGVVLSFAWPFQPGTLGCAGVAFSPQRGIVTVGTALSQPPRLLDFLVVATATEASTGTTRTAYVHVYIHTAIKQLWLTPSTLTVPVGAGSVRFSVLAEFDDGSYGDITNWSPWFVSSAATDQLEVRITAVGQRVLVWLSSNSNDLDVDPRTGVLTCFNVNANVTIRLILRQPTITVTATAVGANSWANLALPWPGGGTVQKLDGPGFAAMANVPNVLIIGDGFTAAEQSAFGALAAQAVADVHMNRRLTPYGLLKDAMNFFVAMAPSRETGVSVWTPMILTPAGGGGALANDHDESFLPAAAVARAPTIASPTQNVSRFLLNERDTAFGAAFGDRPRAQRFNEMRGLHLSERRVDDADLDAFLGALVDSSGATVGSVWTGGPPPGKDASLLVVLSRSLHYGGANNQRPSSGNVICFGLGDNGTHTTSPATTGPGHELVPDATPTTPGLTVELRVVHELGHSFMLGDEYGTPFGQPPRGVIPDSERADANASPNLQTKDTLLTSAHLDPSLTKWGTWPRIVHAGVLTAAPAAIRGGFKLTLAAGHASAFTQGDVVRLRTRPLASASQSDQLVVTSVPSSHAELRVRPMGALTAADFPAGSIVLAPKRDASGNELNLVHAGVKAHMAATGNPLNAAPPPVAPDRPCPGPEPVYQFSTPSLNYGPGGAPNPPSQSAWITGLWERGAQYDCEVYHPTGACLMNVFTFDPGQTQSFQFCWVCRYALVDAIDPTKHGAVDRAIAYRYPK